MIQDAFSHADYPIHILDPEWRFVQANDAFLKLYGYGAEAELQGRDESLLHPASEPAASDGMRGTLASGSPWRGDLVNQARDGAPVDVHVSASPIFREGGIAGYIVFSFDRSQLMELERQLFRAGRMAALGTLGAALAHELNNPLASILLDAEYLRDAHARPAARFDHESALQAAESVIRGVERVRRVLDHLRLFVQQDTGNAPSTLSVEDLLKDSLLLMERQLQARGICLGIRADGGLFVSGNRTLLESVFHNLLGNSRDAFEARAGDGERRITIEADYLEKERSARIRYSDNAGGIPPEILERVFEPFFTTKGSQGTGLGLSVCRQIILRHGGSITCESRSGRTEFTVLLPGSRSPGQEQEQALEEPALA